MSNPSSLPVNVFGVEADRDRSLAELQLEWARKDPRLELNRAPMPDFFWALEEIERTRMTYMGGVLAMTHNVEREARRLGIEPTEAAQGPGGSLRHAWEQQEIAHIEQAKDYPFQNAWSLVSMYGALDALVEDVVPHARSFVAIRRIMQMEEREPELAAKAKESLGDERWDEVMQTLVPVLVDEIFPEPPPRLGAGRKPAQGAERFERVLRAGMLGARPDRPVPDDLSDALAEMGAMRHVLVHRAGRIDDRALRQAPTLAEPYAGGELIRMTSADYRKYSAAIRCYGMEVERRMIGPGDLDFALVDWRDQRVLNA